MPEFHLTSEPPLFGRKLAAGANRLTTLSDLALVSVAIPLGGEKAAQAAIRAAYGAELPAVGRYSKSPPTGTFLIRTTPDQGLIAFEHRAPDAEQIVARQLDGAVYTTDQTDGWVGLQLTGPEARAALERICPLDLHPVSFGPDAAARTVAEHLGVLILNTQEDSFLLLSASSSAESFWHSVETSLSWVT